MKQDAAYLILADGTVFEGLSIGVKGTVTGETVFTTGMTGYLETLTDPSYYGQIVTQTFPLIGNYGDIGEDYESRKCWVRGYIIREICEKPSNFRCGGTLDDFLKAQGIIGIKGLDTRALTKKLRESGVMNGMIASGEDAEIIVESLKKNGDILNQIRAYKIEDAVKSVQTDEIFAECGQQAARENLSARETPAARENLSARETPATQCASKTHDPSKHVVLYDFGAKLNIQRELEKRGCKVTVVPCDTSAEKVLSLSPDGIMLSNGPGDPAENVNIIEEIRKLCEYGKIPIFGICLGHQMLALARGAKTSKLKYGHRGGNHPVKDLNTNRVYITSQNHGYAVEPSSLPLFAHNSFINVNDNTCEGIVYTDIPAFSVQFHPEACGGPHDTNFLFDRFYRMM